MKYSSLRAMCLIMFITLLLPATALAQVETYMDASKVIGYSDFDGTPVVTGQAFTKPRDVAIDPTTDKVFVLDETFPIKVYRFASLSDLATSDAEAEAVFTVSVARRPDVVYTAYAICLDSEGNLYLSYNDYINKFPNATTSGNLTQGSGNAVVEASDNNPIISIDIDDDDRLWVLQYQDNDITYFNDITTAGNLDDWATDKDGFLNNGVPGGGNGDIWVSDDGTLYYSNDRPDAFTSLSLYYNAKNKADNSTFDKRFLGNSTWLVGSVIDNSGYLYLTEIDHHRIFVYKNPSDLTNGDDITDNWDYLIGQEYGHITTSGQTQKKMNNPIGIDYSTTSGYLCVAEREGKRVMIFQVSVSAPEFRIGYPRLENTTTTTSDLVVKLDDVGKVSYVVLDDGMTAPGTQQIVDGKDASGNNLAANRKGTITVDGTTSSYTQQITGLAEGTDYDVYLVPTSSSNIPADNATLLQLETLTQENQGGDNGDASAGSGTIIFRSEVTDNNGDGSTNYLTVYMIDDGSGGFSNLPSGENTEDGRITQRADVVFGVIEHGDVGSANLYLPYDPNVINPENVRILKRSDDSDTWTDITHLAVLDRENNQFIIYNIGSFSQFSFGAGAAGVFLAFNANYPDISDIGGPDITLTANLNGTGTAYYLVVETGKPVPTQAQIKNPSTYTDDYASSGSISVGAANTDYSTTATGLSSSKGYTVYMYAENLAGNDPTAIAHHLFNTGNGVPVSDWIIPIVMLLIAGTFVLRYRFRMQ